jgi:hypothetical protein
LKRERLEFEQEMETEMNTILIVLAALCLVGYLFKRRSRIKTED